MTRLGMLGSRRRVEVDRSGVVSFPGMAGSVRAWIGTGEGWLDPSQQTATRQQRLGALSGVETRTRVGNGDVVICGYGVYVKPDVFAFEVTNDTATPVAIAFVAEGFGASWGEVGVFSGNTLLLPRMPRDQQAGSSRASVWTSLASASLPADTGTPSIVTPNGRVPTSDAQAFVYPLAHGATIRVGLCLDPGTLPTGAPDSLPSLDAVRHGWEAQLRRGMHTVLPDPRLQAVVDASRVELLLSHEVEQPGPDSMIALEDWGFDPEAKNEFEHLGFLNRRRVTTRPGDPAPWQHLEHLLATMTPTLTFTNGPAEFLNHLRSLLAYERPDRTVDLLTHFPADWKGHPVEVNAVPTRGGLVSYAVRWHDSRPALLWESEMPGLRLHAPGLDPLWMTEEQHGEALLAPFAY